MAAISEQNPLGTGARHAMAWHAMPSPRLAAEQQSEIESLAQVIPEAVDGEARELAANLPTTDDAHLFGDIEFRIRALAHKIAAQAIEQHLAPRDENGDLDRTGDTGRLARPVNEFESY